MTLTARASLLAALLWATPSFAQTSFPTQNPGINAQGSVEMCLDTKGTAVPCSDLTARPVRIVGGVPTGPYPAGSIPITGIGAGSTGAVVGTLAAAGAKTTYICGFDVSALGGTATVGPIVVAGLNGGSFTYQFSSTAAGATLNRAYSPCIPAATPGLAITVTTTADGTATAVDVNAWGFQL